MSNKPDDKDIIMEHLEQLLKDLENISFADISTLPDGKQPIIVNQIEDLQEELKMALVRHNE